MTRRVVLSVLATFALNTAIALGLVGFAPERHAFWPTFVQSQSIGFSIAALCWTMAPRVERAQGDPRVAVPLFGLAIVAGALGGMQLAALLTAWLFPPEALGPGGLGHGVLSLRTALLSLGVGVAGTAIVYGRERLRHARTRAESEGWRAIAAERSAAQAQLQALRAQVEPHFLFNTLASVSALIDRDPAAARALLDDLARHLRATLRHARAERTTLGEELDVTASLLSIMKRRLGDRLQWRFDVPDTLRGAAVAPMLVQPLVENAVKHGIEPQPGGGAIEVRARRDDAGGLVVEVTDTGRGLLADGAGANANADAGAGAGAGRGSPSVAGASTDAGTGTGLANLAARLHAIYGPRARVVLRDNPPGGTVARLVLPATVDAS